MPVEVRELVIKATIMQENVEGGGASSTSLNNDVSPGEAMIKICVEKVLEILKEKDGR